MIPHRVRVWSTQPHEMRLWCWYCADCDAREIACASQPTALRRALAHAPYRSRSTRGGARDPRGLDIHP